MAVRHDVLLSRLLGVWGMGEAANAGGICACAGAISLRGASYT